MSIYKTQIRQKIAKERRRNIRVPTSRAQRALTMLRNQARTAALATGAQPGAYRCACDGGAIRKCFLAVARERLKRGKDEKELVSRVHVADFRCREAISGRALPVASGDARRVAVVGAHWRFFRESKPFEKFFERPRYICREQRAASSAVAARIEAST